MPSEEKKDKKKFIVCISGYAGSGKTTLVNYLKEKGACTISADELGHKALSLAKDEIVKTFGSDVISPERDDILRDKLREKLKTKEDWKKLESITHPLILKLLKRELENSNCRVYFIDVAIPFTTGIYKLCDVMIKIHVPQDIIKKRLFARGLSEEFIENLLKKQEYDMNREYDHVIENNINDLNYFLKSAHKTIKQILENYRLKIS